MCDGDLSLYKRAFDRLDADGNGSITGKELSVVFRQFGHNPSDSEIASLINEVDKDNNGTIEFAEFVDLAKRYKYILVNEGNLRETFKQMDKNGDGALSREEFSIALKELGRQLTEGEMDAVLRQVDKNGDGQITYEEFEQHWLSHQ